MARERDSDELKRVLGTYTSSGYRVSIPTLGEGVVERQLFADVHAAFRVRADKPMPFAEYARRLGLSDRRMTREEHAARHPGRSIFFPEQVEAIFSEGRNLSEQEVNLLTLRNMECLDEGDRVTCAVAPWSQVVIPVLRRGMLVEYAESAGGIAGLRVWAGRIVGIEREDGVALLELFVPSTFMRTPEAIVPEKIKKGYYSSLSLSFGYGLHQALEDNEPALVPPGKWTEDEREYVLDQPVELSVIEDFCRRNYPDEGHCVWHAMLMYICPVRATGGAFHPLREDTVGAYAGEVEVRYE